MSAPILCWVATLHSAAVPFAPTVAKVLPSGLNVSAPRLAPGPIVTAVPVSCWVLTFHSRALPSVPMAATSEPSGLKATGPPASAAGSVPPIRWPVAVDHSCRPSAATARILPSGLSASPVTV